MRSFNKLYKELMESVIWQPKVTIPLGITRKKEDSGFDQDNPSIRKFAMSSPDNLAMVFAFVFYTMQTPWAEVLHGFPKFIEWFYTKAVVRKGNRLMVDRNAKPPSYLGHLMTGEHKETGLASEKLTNFYDVYDNRHKHYENIVKRIDDVYELFDYVVGIKGLANPKAAFVVQLISGKLGCFDSVNVKSYDISHLNTDSPNRDEFGKLTKAGRKHLNAYIEHSNPMSKELWDDWCEIIENKFLFAKTYSSEEKKRGENEVIATDKGGVINTQVAYKPNSRTGDRIKDYTNKRLKGSKMDGRNVSRDHYTIFKDIEPFIRKEAVEQIIESVGGYIPSMMTKQQRQVIVDSIKNKTLSRKDTIQALTKINPSDMMAITEKLDTNTLKYLAGMTDKSRTETLSFLRRGINKIKDNMHSSTNKSPMTDDVMIRKPVDITARKVVVDPYTESFNHQYKMLMKEYVEDFDQKWDKAVSESEELQVALDLMKNIKKKN